MTPARKNTLGSRIAYIRTSERLTKTAFGAKIGFSRSYISVIESGKKPASDRFVKLVCSEFGVYEDYLRTGKGPPRVSEPAFEADMSEELAAVIAEAGEDYTAGLSQDDKEWLEVGRLLKPGQRASVVRAIKRSLAKGQPPMPEEPGGGPEEV